MSTNTILINGQVLPAVLVRALDEGWWAFPLCNDALASMFPPHTDTSAAMLYSLEIMQRENHNLVKSLSRPPDFLGTPGAGEPGTLDPARAVIIGDLGPDCPIALDYRNSPESPGVVYFAVRDWHGVWQRIADCIEDFVSLLGIHA